MPPLTVNRPRRGGRRRGHGRNNLPQNVPETLASSSTNIDPNSRPLAVNNADSVSSSIPNAPQTIPRNTRVQYNASGRGHRQRPQHRDPRNTHQDRNGDRPIGGRGNVRNRRARGGTRVEAGRQFGGQLTTVDETRNQSSHPTLQADAAEFIPNEPNHGTVERQSVPSSPSQPKRNQQHSRRGSIQKSTAPDLSTRIHEDIAHTAYECLICMSELSRNSMSNQHQMETFHHNGGGDALAAIFHKTLLRMSACVGVKRKLIPTQSQVFPRSHVAKPAENHGYYLRSAPIHVNSCVMLVLAHHVLTWGLCRPAFAARTLHQKDVSILTMKMGGAAEKFVEI
ncbi:MAG: FKBP12-associated protein [Cirrosporium novae-zelandiae]|nr:MAG: FKBP12-associated protein [Cirrosporium novae-zelandiae]